MHLGKASAYAALATVFIAHNQSAGPVHGRRIAEAHHIPPEYLLKILQQLVRARVLRSETGRRGGFVLKQSPEETTLLDIVEAVEGPLDGELAVGSAITGAEETRSRIEHMCRDIAVQTRTLLQQTTVHDLMNGKAK